MQLQLSHHAAPAQSSCSSVSCSSVRPSPSYCSTGTCQWSLTSLLWPKQSCCCHVADTRDVNDAAADAVPSDASDAASDADAVKASEAVVQHRIQAAAVSSGHCPVSSI